MIISIPEQTFKEFTKKVYRHGQSDGIPFFVIANTLDILIRYYTVESWDDTERIDILHAAFEASYSVLYYPLAQSYLAPSRRGLILKKLLKTIDGLIVLPGIDHVFQMDYSDLRNANYDFVKLVGENILFYDTAPLQNIYRQQQNSTWRDWIYDTPSTMKNLITDAINSFTNPTPTTTTRTFRAVNCALPP